MPRKIRSRAVADAVLDAPDASLLDVLDRVLTKGVVASGDVTMGVAGVDLIYLRLSALLCATDRVMPLPPRRRARTKR
jgi:Gas vesicle protein